MMFDEHNRAKEMVKKLRDAALKYDARTDRFAAGKNQTCRDIARKLEKHGSFASAAQADFASKLITWAEPRAQPVRSPLELPKTRVLVSKFARLYYKSLKFAKKNGEQIWWVCFADNLVGKMNDAGGVELWDSKLAAADTSVSEVTAILREFEADPISAMKAEGIATGRCCCCSRELTDPVSIANGIGPICEAKAGGF